MASIPSRISAAPDDPPPHRVEREARRAENRRRHWGQTAARRGAPDAVAEPDLGPEPDMSDCPDPSSPDALKLLFAAFYRRMWRMAKNARATHQDIVTGFGVVRLAAGVGKVAPKQTEYHLPMESLLPPPHATGPFDGAQTPGDGKPGAD